MTINFVGTVDGVEGGRIKLTRKDSDAGFEGGTHSGHHHYLSTGLVAEIEGDRVRLSANGDVAWINAGIVVVMAGIVFDGFGLGVVAAMAQLKAVCW